MLSTWHNANRWNQSQGGVGTGTNGGAGHSSCPTADIVAAVDGSLFPPIVIDENEAGTESLTAEISIYRRPDDTTIGDSIESMICVMNAAEKEKGSHPCEEQSGIQDGDSDEDEVKSFGSVSTLSRSPSPVGTDDMNPVTVSVGSESNTESANDSELEVDKGNDSENPGVVQSDFQEILGVPTSNDDTEKDSWWDTFADIEEVLDLNSLEGEQSFDVIREDDMKDTDVADGILLEANLDAAVLPRELPNSKRISDIEDNSYDPSSIAEDVDPEKSTKEDGSTGRSSPELIDLCDDSDDDDESDDESSLGSATTLSRTPSPYDWLDDMETDEYSIPMEPRMTCDDENFYNKPEKQQTEGSSQSADMIKGSNITSPSSQTDSISASRGVTSSPDEDLLPYTITDSLEGRKLEAVISPFLHQGKIFWLLKLEDSNGVEIVPGSVMNNCFPQHIIKFYQKKLRFVNDKPTVVLRIQDVDPGPYLQAQRSSS